MKYYQAGKPKHLNSLENARTSQHKPPIIKQHNNHICKYDHILEDQTAFLTLMLPFPEHVSYRKLCMCIGLMTCHMKRLLKSILALFKNIRAGNLVQVFKNDKTLYATTDITLNIVTSKTISLYMNVVNYGPLPNNICDAVNIS